MDGSLATQPAGSCQAGGDLVSGWRFPDELEGAIADFEDGAYSKAHVCASSVVKRLSEQRLDAAPAAVDAGFDRGHRSEDLFRTTLKSLASSHEAAGEPCRAESLYLRMLAWKQGAEQYGNKNVSVAHRLFQRSPEYTTVEDAVWYLKDLQPCDGHAIADVVALLALGEEAASKAAVALWTLALRKEHRAKIVENGALEMLLGAVDCHTESLELLAACCSSLRLLCSGHRLAQQSRRCLVSAGAVETVLSVVHRHVDGLGAVYTEVLREACAVLKILTLQPSGAWRALEAGGIELCLRVCAGCSAEDLSDACAGVVKSLCSHANPQGIAADPQVHECLRQESHPGLHLCEKALRQNLGDLPADISGSGSHWAAPQSLLSAAAALIQTTAFPRRALGLVGPALMSMKLATHQPKLQLAACSLLRCFLNKDCREEVVLIMIECEGIFVFGQTMRDFACHHEIQKLALAVTEVVVQQSNEYKTQGIKAGCMQAALAAMKRFPDDADLVEHAVKALTSLCDTVGRCSTFVKRGGIDLAVSAALRHRSHGAAESALKLLLMCCDDPLLQHQVASCGTLDFKLLMQDDSADGTRRWAMDLSRELADRTACRA